MDKETGGGPNLDLRPIQPCVPEFGTLGLSTELGRSWGKNFEKALWDRFRRPIRTWFGKEFWEYIGANYRPEDVCVYRGTITRGINEGGMKIDLLLAILVHLQLREIPKLPSRESVGAACYMEAIKYAQNAYQKSHRIPWDKGKQLAYHEFYSLLYLFNNDNWFMDRYFEKHKYSQRQRQNSEQKREEMASAILNIAKARMALLPPDFIGGHAGRKFPSVEGSVRKYLERLQDEWAAGWIIAIKKLPFKWEV